jgi:hypothetical protein
MSKIVGALPVAELLCPDTDPEPFGPRELTHDSITVKRCVKCGQEIGGNTQAFERGAYYALNAAFVWFQKQGGMVPQVASAIVHRIRAELGF